MADWPEYVYRAMIEEEGVPRIGASATTLGIREGKDVVVDEFGMVTRPDFARGAPNGLSCAPTVADLPEFARPEEWGGDNRRTRVWRLATTDVDPDLVVEMDAPGHVSIGPARDMLLDEYVQLINGTVDRWELVQPDNEERQ